MNHLFVINPVAGKGKALKTIPEIKRVFSNKGEPYFVEVTKKPGHATEIVRQYVSKDKFRVYSVGGDGTLNEVLNGMAGSSSSLAIIPCGSGNDFIKSLSPHYNSKDILIKTIKGNEQSFDLAKVNDKYFINISSIGFDAQVVHNTNRIKKLPGIPGKLAYIMGVFITLFKYRSNRLKITIDQKEIETKALLVAVANGKFYGGGMQPAPQAVIDDGILDICLIKGINKFKIMKFFPKIIKGTHGDIPEVSFHKAERVEIQCVKPVAANIDGEVTLINEATFQVIPEGINIVVP